MPTGRDLFLSNGSIGLLVKYNGNKMVYVRSVTVPDCAKVYVEINKFKADRIILADRQKI